jgi:Cys-rich four helix bundle protein (predicted Tat secretion target)
MNRRTLLATGLGAGLALAAGTRGRADAQPRKAPAPPPAKPNPRAALLSSLQTCLAKAQACAAHCDQQLAAGAKDFARCAAAVADMLAVGWTTQNMVARRSALSKRIVEACTAACKACSAACLEHKAHWSHGMHVECKECMDACDACDKACAAYLAA